MSIVWSFSSLKTFQQCPKKYYHTKIAKDVVEPDTQATLYGKTAHTVAEEYIRDGKPVPPAFDQTQLHQIIYSPDHGCCLARALLVETKRFTLIR